MAETHDEFRYRMLQSIRECALDAHVETTRTTCLRQTYHESVSSTWEVCTGESARSDRLGIYVDVDDRVDSFETRNS